MSGWAHCRGAAAPTHPEPPLSVPDPYAQRPHSDGHAVGHGAPAAPPAYPTNGASPWSYGAPPAAPTAAPYGFKPHGQTPPAYGSVPGYPAPGQGNPASPFQPGQYYGPAGIPLPTSSRTNGLAIASIVVASVCLVLGGPVSAGVLAIVGGVVGLGLGIAGLRRARAGVVGGKGQATVGIVVSAVSAIVGTVLVFTVGPAFVAGFTQGWESALQGEGPSGDPWDGDGVTDDEWIDIPTDTLALGEAATMGQYTVTVMEVQLDADDDVLAADSDNAPAAGQYVQALVSVTYNGTGVGRPFRDLLVSYPGADDYIYDEAGCWAITADYVYDVGPVAPGETVDFLSCMDVPSEAIDGAAVMIEDMTVPFFRGEVWSSR